MRAYNHWLKLPVVSMFSPSLVDHFAKLLMLLELLNEGSPSIGINPQSLLDVLVIELQTHVNYCKKFAVGNMSFSNLGIGCDNLLKFCLTSFDSQFVHYKCLFVITCILIVLSLQKLL